MTCNKTKLGFFSSNKIYADQALTIEVIDAIDEYDSDTAEGKGLIVNNENGNPYFFQTDLNSSIKEMCQTLIDAFSITTLPTSAYEIELDTNLKAAKVKLEDILKNIP